MHSERLDELLQRFHTTSPRSRLAALGLHNGVGGIRKAARCRFIALTVMLFLGLPNSLAAQQGAKAMAQPECVQYADFAHVTTKELNRHAIHRQQPDSVLLKQTGVRAAITVKTFVNDTGQVVCASVVGDANPFLAKISLEAARAWRFRPLVRGARAVGMQGDLLFSIDR